MIVPPISRVEPLPGLENSADVLPQDAVERFTSALEAAARVKAVRGVDEDGRPASKLNPEALIAADDAWVNILAISEKLQDGEVTAAEAAALEGLLLRSWDAFQDQLNVLAAALPERRDG